MIEVWKAVEGYDDMYQVSTQHRVKSYKWKTPRLLKQALDTKGYLFVNLWKNNKQQQHRVHRLLAKAFIPNPDNKPCVNHIDEVRNNNDLDNLEWCTHKENSQHSIRKFGGGGCPLHYKFLNPEGELVEIFNLKEFCKDKNICASNMCVVHSGKERMHKGWTKYDSKMQLL